MDDVCVFVCGGEGGINCARSMSLYLIYIFVVCAIPKREQDVKTIQIFFSFISENFQISLHFGFTDLHGKCESMS